MNRTILYYPTIDVPNNGWLKHALLYWDEVSSIIPIIYNDRFLRKLSPDIHYLIEEGHFRPIRPENLVADGENWDEFEKFQSEFKDVISGKSFQRILKGFRAAGKDYRIHRNKIVNRNIARIHSNKTSESLYDYLESVVWQAGKRIMSGFLLSVIQLFCICPYLQNI